MTDARSPPSASSAPSVKRSEDPRILTGSGQLRRRHPAARHAARRVRAQPVAHAKITSVDVDEARALPGVVAVYTGADIQALLAPGAAPLSMFPGCPRLRSASSPPTRSASSATRSRSSSPRAATSPRTRAELVEVDYDELDAVASSADALDPTEPPIFDGRRASNVLPTDGRQPRRRRRRVRQGRPASSSAQIDQHRHQNVPMECRGIVADYDPATGHAHVHGSNQGVAPRQDDARAASSGSPRQVRVLCGDIGGSFGLKIGAVREDIACALRRSASAGR